MAMLTFAAVLTPMRESMGVELFAISVVGNISYFSFGLLAPLSGFLADRIGSRRVIVLCLGGMAAAAVAVALSPNVYVLAVALAALGLAAAIYHPAGLSLVARRVAAVEKGMAYHGIFGSFGLALGPLAAGAVAAAAGWRWAYAALALPLAAAAVAFATFGGAAKSEVHEKPARADIPGRTMVGALVIYYAAALLIGFIFQGGTTFLPTYLGTMKNLFVGNAATTATLLAGIGGQYLGGLMAARWRHELVLAAEMLTCGAALVVLGFVSGPALLAPALVFGVAFFATQPVTNTLISRLTSPRRQGTAYGVNFFLTFGLGSFGTSFTGFIGQNMRLAEAFRLLGLVAWASVPLALILWAARRRDSSGVAPAPAREMNL